MFFPDACIISRSHIRTTIHFRQNTCIDSNRIDMTNTTPRPCRFCNLPEQRILLEDQFAYVVRDSLPVSPGHTLIILRRHLVTLFETTKEERLAMFDLMDQ